MAPPRGEKEKVVIIGGGIAGLSCAYKIIESDAFKQGRLDVTLLESKPRLGGIIETTSHDGCILEGGPDSFITNKPYMVDLAKRLGIADRIIGTEQTNRGAMVVSRGKLVKLPEGFNLMAPSQILPFLESPIMSMAGKMRVMAEPFLPVRQETSDESVADFVRRRFGVEMLQKIVQPMIGGIYVGDVEKLSVSMAAERFVEMEQKSGSVLSGLMKEVTARGEAGDAAGGAQHGVRYGLFCSFDRGMEVIVDALLAKLSPVEIRLGSRVSEVSFQGARGEKPWRINTADSELTADHVVMALPSRLAGRMIQGCAPTLAGLLIKIDAASSAVISFILDRKDVGRHIDAFGVVVPEVEMRRMGLNVIALSFASQKFAGRAPEGKLVVRAFLGGIKGGALLGKNNEYLEDLAMRDMRRLLGYSRKGRPDYVKVSRWPASMPQYHVGHRDLLVQIDAAAAAQPGLYLAGASYRGVGLPECVRSGEESAEKILSSIN